MNPLTELHRYSSYQISHDDIGCLDFDEEGICIASADDRGDVIVVDVTSGKVSMQCTAHENICSCVCFSPYAQNELFSGGLDCHIKSWDTELGEIFWEESTLSAESQAQMINPPMVFDITVSNTSRWQGLMAAACGNGAIYLRNESEEGSHMSGDTDSASVTFSADSFSDW